MKKYLKSYLAILLVFCVFLTGFDFKANAESKDKSQKEKVYLVKYKLDKNETKSKTKKKEKKEKIKEFVKANNGKVRLELPEMPMVTVRMTEKEAMKLKKSNDIEYVIEDESKFYPMASSGTETTNWGLDKIGSPTLNRSGYTGQGVKVAVIDSGVAGEYGHPILGDNIADGISLVYRTQVDHNGEEYTFLANLNDQFDDEVGHGTHVAGTIAGDNGIGVAPNTSLYIIKVFEKNNGTNAECYPATGATLEQMVGAIHQSIFYQVDIINLSLGSDGSKRTPEELDFYETAINAAYERGITVVASAGNEGFSKEEIEDDTTKAETINVPAKFENAISVGAIDNQENRSYFNTSPEEYDSTCQPIGEEREHHSASGMELDVVAPGSDIYSYSLDYTGTTVGLVSFQGTSMAAPHVSGLLALYKERNGELTPFELKSMLVSNAKDLGEEGWDRYTGFGLVNAMDFPDTPVEGALPISIPIDFDGSDLTFYEYPDENAESMTRRYSTSTLKATSTEVFGWDESRKRFNWYKVSIPQLSIENKWYKIISDHDETKKIFEDGLFTTIGAGLRWNTVPYPADPSYAIDDYVDNTVKIPAGTGFSYELTSVQNVSSVYIDQFIVPADFSGYKLKLTFYGEDGTLMSSYDVTDEDLRLKVFKLPKALTNVKKVTLMQSNEATATFELGELDIFSTSTPGDSGDGEPIITPAPADLTGLQAGTVTKNSIEASWTTSDNATKYKLEYRKVGETEFVFYQDVTETSANIPNLASNTEYDIKVTPFNEDVEGTSATVTAKTKMETPDALSGLAASNIKSNSIDLSWASSLNAEKYKVEYRVSGATAYTLFDETTSKNITVSGLSGDKEYEFRVTPINTDSSGTPGTIKAKTLMEVPAAVTGLKVVDNKPSFLSVMWNPSARASKYKVEYKKKADTAFSFLTETTYTNYTVVWLAKGTAYDIRVTPINSGGSGTSQTISATTTTNEAYSDELFASIKKADSRTDENITGVSAKIYTPKVYPYQTDSWAETYNEIIFANGSLGWMRNGSNYHFYFKNTNTGAISKLSYGPLNGSTHSYQIRLEGSTLIGTVNGVEIGRIAYDGSMTATLRSYIKDYRVARYAGSSADPSTFNTIRINKNGSWVVPEKLTFHAFIGASSPNNQGWYKDSWTNTNGTGSYSTYDYRN